MQIVSMGPINIMLTMVQKIYVFVKFHSYSIATVLNKAKVYIKIYVEKPP